MSKQYDDYLETHIANVKKCHEIIFGEKLESHDDSKYFEEYKAYDHYFYPLPYSGNSKAKAVHDIIVEREFDYAWLHHIHNNHHHWQHWILPQDDGTIKALDIPKKYIKEMIADWASFSFLKEDPDSLISWYASNREKQKMSYRTRRLVDKYVELAYDKLKEYFENIR